MYRIIIADDEVHICQLIRHLIDWEGLDAQLCGVASNGVEAYELIRTQHPHIVISDIRMSGMDGLGLLEQVRNEGITCAYILVSGYREFEYAQRAIQLGVTDYLVKPINKQALNAAIRKGIAKLETIGLPDSAEAVQRHTPSSQGLSTLKSDLEADAELLGRYSLHELAEQKGISGPFRIFYWKAVCGESYTREAMSLLQNRVMELFETQTWFDQSVSAFWEQGGVLAGSVSGRPLPNVMLLQSQCLEILTQFPHWRVILGSCDPLANEPLRQSIHRAQQAAQHHYFHPAEACFSAGPPEQTLGMTDLAEQLNLTVLSDAMKLLDADLVLCQVRDDFRKLEQLKTTSLLFCYAGWLVDTMNHALSAFIASHTGLEHIQYLHRSELLEQFYHCPSLLSFSACICGALEQCIHETRHAIEQMENKPVRMVRDMVERHYMEHISLNDAADAVDLNPVYLSALFKKETGINFKDYLTNVRMEHAKELLQHGESINQVSELVGYQDTKYFSRLFARVVGVNPTQYKKLYH